MPSFSKYIIAGSIAILLLFFQLKLAAEPLLRDRIALILRLEERKNNLAAEEALLAFDWLKENTPANSVIIAPPYESHRITAFADRRVIASGKVYPSETKEVARRLRDISKFFFTADINEAKAIIEKYGAQYVLLPRKPQFSKFCEAGRACHWVTYREKKGLTPDGRQKTLIGRLIYYEDPQDTFQLIWSSPNFLIYRIVKNTTPAPCEISQIEKVEAARYVRQILELHPQKIQEPAGNIFHNNCGLHVAIWQDGKIIASSTIANKTLAETLNAAARELTRNLNKNLNIRSAKIEFVIWDGKQEVPQKLEEFLQNRILPRRGYFLKSGNEIAYALPPLFNEPDWNPKMSARLFSYLCAKTEKNLCDDAGKIHVGYFLAESWIDDGTENELKFLASGALKKRLEMTLDSIIALQQPVLPNDAFGAALALAKANRLFPGKMYIISAESFAAAAYDGLNRYPGPYRTSDLAYAVLANLELWSSSKKPYYLTQSRKFAEYLISLQRSDGLFANEFKITDKGVIELSLARDLEINSASLFALAEYYKKTDAKETWNAIQKIREPIKTEFLTRRIASGHFGNPAVSTLTGAWLARAFGNLYGIEKLPEDAEFALAAARWMIESQHPAGAPVTGGAFQPSPPNPSVNSSITGQAALALADTVRLTKSAGAPKALYEERLRQALLWLISAQSDAGNPIESSYNFALAGLEYLELD